MRRQLIPMLRQSLWTVCLSLSSLGMTTAVQADPLPAYVCPNEVEPLVQKLMQDLPGYANRLSVRIRPESLPSRSYIVFAGRPEFEPLPLTPEQASTSNELPNDPHQVFLTTLERQYVDRQVTQLQEFHWIFLTQSEDGWRLAFMYTRTGQYPAQQPPTPPRESSDGLIAQAIRLWLRDCRAGAVRMTPERSPIAPIRLEQTLGK
jgi:hypothetical protein